MADIVSELSVLPTCYQLVALSRNDMRLGSRSPTPSRSHSRSADEEEEEGYTYPRSSSASSSDRSATSFSRSPAPSRSRSPQFTLESSSDAEHRRYIILGKERKDNLQGLPQFLDATRALVELPFELDNEPYSYYDTELRSEIVKPRSRFLFEVSNDSYSSKVGHKFLSARSSPAVVPEKHETNVSLLTVYDTYGLEVAYAFLHRIYYHKFLKTAPRWLVGYLEACLIQLQPSYIPDHGNIFSGSASERVYAYQALYLSSEILRELEQLENNKFIVPETIYRRSSPTSQVQLPVDILSRIVPSTRLSKQIRSDVKQQRCLEVPRTEELVDNNPVLLLDNNLFTSYSTGLDKYVYLSIEQDDYRLFSTIEDEEPYAATVQDKVNSVASYRSAYKSRDCNVNQAVTLMLQGVRDRLQFVTDQNTDEICAWIVNLTADLDINQNEVVLREADLVPELQRLIALEKAKM